MLRELSLFDVVHTIRREIDYALIKTQNLKNTEFSIDVSMLHCYNKVTASQLNAAT